MRLTLTGTEPIELDDNDNDDAFKQCLCLWKPMPICPKLTSQYSANFLSALLQFWYIVTEGQIVVKSHLQSAVLASGGVEAPSGGQSSYHQSVQTTSHVTGYVADWDSTVGQMEYGSIVVRSSEEPQICLMQMGYSQLTTQKINTLKTVTTHHQFIQKIT